MGKGRPPEEQVERCAYHYLRLASDLATFLQRLETLTQTAKAANDSVRQRIAERHLPMNDQGEDSR